MLRTMRTFADSAKSKKTIVSMIVTKDKPDSTSNTGKKISPIESPSQPIFDANIGKSCLFPVWHISRTYF